MAYCHHRATLHGPVCLSLHSDRIRVVASPGQPPGDGVDSAKSLSIRSIRSGTRVRGDRPGSPRHASGHIQYNLVLARFSEHPGRRRAAFWGMASLLQHRCAAHSNSQSAEATGGVARSILGPGSIRIDTGLSRTLRVRENQSVQVRIEAFNFPNHLTQATEC